MAGPAERLKYLEHDFDKLDLNGDGFLDRIYVPNMGGQLFRIDFDIIW